MTLFKKLQALFNNSTSPKPLDASVVSPKNFLDGAYRLHRSDDIARFTAIAAEAFPEYANRITCFGADWLGTQFATDEERVDGSERLVLMLEPGTGKVLEIPSTYDAFHSNLLVYEPDAVAAYSFYKDWVKSGGSEPKYNQCVGYRKPLFLGGSDDLTNLEICDFEVYWSINAQLLAQVRDLPRGTVIGNVTIGG